MSDTSTASAAEAGLTTLEARRRLRQLGPNLVADQGEVPLWQLALGQFRNLVVLLLLAASGIAWVLGERAEAVAILVALMLNAAIGFGSEWRAPLSLARLRALVAGRPAGGLGSLHHSEARGPHRSDAGQAAIHDNVAKELTASIGIGVAADR